MVDADHNSAQGGADAPEDLVRAAAAGSPQAWEAIVRLYAPRLYAMVMSRTRNATVSEDVTQAVLATVAVKLCQGGYNEVGRFESWLFRIAMNRVRDHVRSIKRRGASASLDEAPELAAEGHDAGGAEEHALLSKRLGEAMMKLSDADREVIELRHHGGMSFRDMAEVLDEPVGTLLARHHRALAKLKAILHQTNADRMPRDEGGTDGTNRQGTGEGKGIYHAR